jgi:hypothetical protein
MSSTNLIRLGGLAALLGAVLLMIRAVLWILNIGRETDEVPLSEAATMWSFTLANGLELLGFALLLVGLIGLYASQSKAAGTTGLVGILMLSIGVALLLGRNCYEVFVLPGVAVAAPERVDADITTGMSFWFKLPSLFTVPGWLLFAVATLRAGVYPRAATTVLLIGQMVALLPLTGPFEPIGPIIRNVGVAWLGFALLTGRIAGGEDPTPFPNLIRWGALAAVLGGVAWVANGLGGLLIEGFNSSPFAVQWTTSIALICTLGGLAGLHTIQAASRRYGRLGTAGFFLAFIGATLWLNAQGSGELYRLLALPGLVLGMLVGFVLLGVATIRARVLPWWCGWLLIICHPLWFLLIPAFDAVSEAGEAAPTSREIVFGLVWLALGYALFRRREMRVETPSQEPVRRTSISFSSLVRWGGPAALLGASLFVLSDLGVFVLDLPGRAGGLALPGGLLLLLGLVGLHARQSEAAGALGLAGFFGAFIGTGFFVGGAWTNTFVEASLLERAGVPNLLSVELFFWAGFCSVRLPCGPESSHASPPCSL